MKGQTKLVTPVYTKPIPNKKFLALQVLAFRDFTVTQVEKYINPFDGNKEEVYTFGKTPAGWLVLTHDNVVYFEEEACPTCLCAISEEPHFKLPCCGNKLHADCFVQQIKSFKGGLWTESHITCPLCRKNYFGEGRTNKYFWIDYQPLSNALYKTPGFRWEDFESAIYGTHGTLEMIKKIVKEKEKNLPKEEHGGWAIQICESCKGPGIAGKLSCAEAMNIDLSAKYVCDACEWGQKNAKDHRCFLHGKKYAMFKCDSCCDVATWDCFSNHYCERCHDMACDTKHFPCPGPDKCPLGMAHPPNSHGRHGESNLGFVIGCFKCFDPTYEVNSSYNSDAPDPFRADDLANNNNLGLFQYSAPPPPELCPVAKPIAEFVEPVSPEQDEIYDEFIRQFQDSEAETDFSDSEMDESSSESDAMLYQGFVAQFNSTSDEEICSDYEEQILYKGFIAQFDSLDSDNQEEILYNKFIAQFEVSDDEICSDSEIEKFEENIEIYKNFVSQFEVSDNESSCYSIEYESDSSEISIEENLAFCDEEEAQVLPILAPRPMTSCDSLSSVFSEDTLNLLNFNVGFMENGDSDIVSSPAMVQMCSHEVTVI